MAEPISNSTTQGVTPDQETPAPHLSKNEITFSRIKRRILKHVWLARIGIVATVVLGIYLVFFLVGFFFQRVGVTNYPALVSGFLFTPQAKIKSQEGRVNIIVLGKAGYGYDSPDLTDSMVFASISLTKPSVTLISLPRDIWIPAIRAKINSAYYWGNQKQSGGGLILTKSLVEEVLGQPVAYGVVIDFNGFQKIIDTLGGIDVLVERSFTDEEYPIPGKENDTCNGDKLFRCRYETIHFEKGWEHMDGERALKFVRSRKAKGDEGTDIARQARQEKVISAIKNKIFSPWIFLNPRKMFAVWDIVRGSVETDIDEEAGAILVRKAVSGGRFNSNVVPEEFLENPPISARYDNQYVFIAKGGSWDLLHEWVKKLLEGK